MRSCVVSASRRSEDVARVGDQRPAADCDARRCHARKGNQRCDRGDRLRAGIADIDAHARRRGRDLCRKEAGKSRELLPETGRRHGIRRRRCRPFRSAGLGDTEAVRDDGVVDRGRCQLRDVERRGDPGLPSLSKRLAD